MKGSEKSYSGKPVNETRWSRLLGEAVKAFSLNLDQLTVLTEAATGHYMLTPLLAARAGGRKVYALARDSRYGRAKDASSAVMDLAMRFGVGNRIDILTDRTDKRIREADIVTNLGFVRPLDTPFLRQLKETAVIPLMWETWEYRPEDLDIEECRRLGLAVLGTNEHDRRLQTFRYVGLTAVKALLSLDIEIFRSRIAIVGSGEFAAVTFQALKAAGAKPVLLDAQDQTILRTQSTKDSITSADALVVVEHRSRRMLIGPAGEITGEELHRLNPAIAVVHLCGGVDRQDLQRTGIPCYPDHFAEPGYMSMTTDCLGPKPLIDLHAAGLKVGELLARARVAGLSARQAEEQVLTKSSLAQGFEHYRFRV